MWSFEVDSIKYLMFRICSRHQPGKPLLLLRKVSFWKESNTRVHTDLPTDILGTRAGVSVACFPWVSNTREDSQADSGQPCVQAYVPEEFSLRSTAWCWEETGLMSEGISLLSFLRGCSFSSCKKTNKNLKEEWRTKCLSSWMLESRRWWGDAGLLQQHSAACCLQSSFEFLGLFFGHIRSDFLRKRLH